jgi:hypothetical protein
MRPVAPSMARLIGCKRKKRSRGDRLGKIGLHRNIFIRGVKETFIANVVAEIANILPQFTFNFVRCCEALILLATDTRAKGYRVVCEISLQNLRPMRGAPPSESRTEQWKVPIALHLEQTLNETAICSVFFTTRMTGTTEGLRDELRHQIRRLHMLLECHGAGWFGIRCLLVPTLGESPTRRTVSSHAPRLTFAPRLYQTES